MYPGTIIEFDDQSDITSLPIEEVRNQPLFGAVFTSDKGTEEWTRISGSDFFDMYGKTIKFSKHGQPLLQAAMTINAGAELLCKRLVADDAALANLAIYAKIVEDEQKVQLKNEDGDLLYKDAQGEQTIENTGEPYTETVKTTTIKYTKKSVEGLTLRDGTNTICNIDDAITELAKKYDADKDGQLIYVFTDIGRGVSNKRIKIVPNYRLSKGAEYTTYSFSVIEGSSEIESFSFSVNPNLIVNDTSVSLQSMINNNSTQLVCHENVEGIEALVKALSNATGKTEAEILKYDILFGCTNRGDVLDGVTIDAEGIDLDYATGQALEYGTDGAFGTKSAASYLKDKDPENENEADDNVWSKLAIAAFDGSFDKIVYNVDRYKIHAVVDANYPKSVKRAIEALAAFREDFMYFRDQRLSAVSYDAIAANCNKETKSMFCATYPQFYDVIDPYTKRQITVTIGYSLARLLVAHINSGSILPTAGILHNMIIDDAVYGTLSYAPTICPDNNEKEAMEDIKANFASYIDNQLVIETLYTSQEKNSQWSYVNNVMGIQDVVKAIRTKCPTIRYTFIEGEDLEKYKAEVEEVIAPYNSNYLQLSLEYKQDTMYSFNKIFYAVLKVVYKDFVQTEWFKVTALSTVEVSAQ